MGQDVAELKRLREVWAAFGCAPNPDDFKPTVRETMWAQVLELAREAATQSGRLNRENQQLRDALERVTPRVVAEPTIGTRNPDGSITFSGVFPPGATSGVIAFWPDTDPPKALFTPTGKETE